MVLDCEYCNIMICSHLHLCNLLFDCSKFPFSLGLTLQSATRIQEDNLHAIVSLGCSFCDSTTEQASVLVQDEHKRQWHWITHVQKTQRLRWNSTDPRRINAAPTTSDEATRHAEKPGEEDCYTADAEKRQIPHSLDEGMESGALSCTPWLR